VLFKIPRRARGGGEQSRKGVRNLFHGVGGRADAQSGKGSRHLFSAPFPIPNAGNDSSPRDARRTGKCTACSPVNNATRPDKCQPRRLRRSGMLENTPVGRRELRAEGGTGHVSRFLGHSSLARMMLDMAAHPANDGTRFWSACVEPTDRLPVCGWTSSAAPPSLQASLYSGVFLSCSHVEIWQVGKLRTIRFGVREHHDERGGSRSSRWNGAT
jgi:hypothetical protein